MKNKLHKKTIAKRIEKAGQAVKHFFQGAGEIEAVNFELHWPPRVI